MGRLGRIGEADTQTRSSSGGRLGRIGGSVEDTAREAEQSQKEKDKEKSRQRSEIIAFGKFRTEPKEKLLSDQEYQDALSQSKSIDEKIKQDPYSIGNVARGASEGVGNFTAAVNEKTLGTAVRTGARLFNEVATGFDTEKAKKNTDEFLKKTMANEKGQFTLASRGVNREDESFKIGEDIGGALRIGYDAAKNAYKQARIGAENQNLTPEIYENAVKNFDQAVKDGRISRAEAEKRKTDLKKRVDENVAKVKAEEVKQGVEYDPSTGALDAVGTILAVGELGQLGAVVFKAAAQQASKRLGRKLTQQEAQSLADKTKQTVPEQPTKPEPVVERAPESVVEPAEPPVTAKPPKSFAPIEENTSVKISKLVSDSSSKPVPDGHTRLYQTNDKSKANIKSDQYFKETDTLANYINGRSENAQLSFIDVPNEKVQSVPGKPLVFKVADDAPVVKKPKTPRELRTAVDEVIYEKDPELAPRETMTRMLSEDGSNTIPRIHVDDVKKYFGSSDALPNTYKRKSGQADIDQLAQRAGFDDVDEYVEAIQDELKGRAGDKERAMRLSEMRKDPSVVAEAQKRLDADKAYYGKPEEFTPGKRDEKEYDEIVRKKEFGIKESRVYSRLQSEYSDSLGGKKPEYQSTTLKEEAHKAVKLIEEDKQKAYRIAMGSEASDEVTSTSVNIAMAEKALEESNHSLYARLVKNRSLAQTRRGQELVSEKASITDNSTSRYVKELVKSRLEKLGNVTAGTKGTKSEKALARIDKEVAKAEKIVKFKEMDLKSAQSIIDGLVCK